MLNDGLYTNGLSVKPTAALNQDIFSDLEAKREMLLITRYGELYLQHKEQIDNNNRLAKQQESFNDAAAKFLDVVRTVQVAEAKAEAEKLADANLQLDNNMHGLKQGFSRQFHSRVREYVKKHERDMQFFWMEVARRNMVQDHLEKMRASCELYRKALSLVSNIEHELQDSDDVRQLDLHRDFCEREVRTLEDGLANYEGRMLNTQYDLTKIYELFNNLHLPMENMIRTLPMSSEEIYG